MKKALLKTIGAVSVCLAGCSSVSSQVGGVPSPEFASQPTPGPVDWENEDIPVYTEDVSAIITREGNGFTIQLASNRATGYSWELADDYSRDIIEPAGAEYRDPEVQRRGAEGQELFRFQAVGAGHTKLTFNYRRPWEKETAPVKTLTFGVEVRPPN